MIDHLQPIHSHFSYTPSFRQSSGHCILSSQLSVIESQYPTASASSVTFNRCRTGDGRSIFSSTVSPSAPIAAIWTSVAANCTYQRDRRSCQQLANLCALNRYSTSHPSCALFSATAAQITTIINGLFEVFFFRIGVPSHVGNSSFPPSAGFTGSGADGWRQSLPLLTWSPDSSSLSTAYSLSSKSSSTLSESSRLHFRIAVYNFAGEFLGLHELNDQIVLCGARGSQLLSFFLLFTGFTDSNLSICLSHSLSVSSLSNSRFIAARCGASLALWIFANRSMSD